jgi:serine/threonine protein kinase
MPVVLKPLEQEFRMELAHTKLGKYEVIKEIGRGGMGVVYCGYDPFVGRYVAIKVAHAESLKDEEWGGQYRKMFFNEAHTTGQSCPICNRLI